MAGDFAGFGQFLAGLGEVFDHADAGGFLCIKTVTGQQVFQRLPLTAQAGHVLCRTARAVPAKLHLWRGKDGRAGDHAKVTGQRDFQAPAKRPALDRRDGGFAQGKDRRDIVEAVAPCPEILVPVQRGDVGACAKGAVARAAKDHHMGGGGFICLCAAGGDLAVHGRGQGVVFGRAVQHDFRDVPGQVKAHGAIGVGGHVRPQSNFRLGSQSDSCGT